MSTPNPFPLIVLPHLFSEDRQKQDLIFVYLFFDALEHYAADSSIYFINPNPFNPFTGNITSVDQAALESEDIRTFKKNYIHLSSNGYIFERYCIERFFYVRQLMSDLNLKKAFLIETDIFIYANPHVLFRGTNSTTDDNYLIQNRCMGFSFVDVEYINGFCDNVLNTYTSDRSRKLLESWYSKYTESGQKGGICDMSICYWMNTGEMGMNAFSSKDIAEPFHANTPVRCLQAFDNSIQTMQLGDLKIKGTRALVNDWPMKQIYFDQGFPYVFTEDGRAVKLLSIHCQGRAKNIIGSIYSMGQKGLSGYLI